jgi:4-hydroxythreonine-4-phosphate dehydrogenase
VTKKTIAITMGDPLGIGPEIICKALLSGNVSRSYRYVIIGNRLTFEKIKLFKKLRSLSHISFLETPVRRHVDTSTQQYSGQLSIKALSIAVSLIKTGQVQALVTAPICKEHVCLAGFKFPGHTEYLCHEFGVEKYAMMFVAPKLRVTLSTIHDPLTKVPKLMTVDTIFEKLTLTAAALQTQFHIQHPNIAVCGLNPHAGENGLLGTEENKIIRPAINKFLKSSFGKKCTVIGPLPADSLFARLRSTHADAILCHYHDQALIPIKMQAPNTAVNLTLGLPFVRTSPAHGTAFDIAGKNRADPGSLIEAIRLAAQLG